MTRDLATALTETPEPTGRSEIGSVLHPDPFTVPLGTPVASGVSSLAFGQPGTETKPPIEVARSSVVTSDYRGESSTRAHIFRLDEVQRPSSLFRTSAGWHGEVLQVDSTSFVARLHPWGAPDIEEVTTFDIDEVEPGDSRFVKPGAMFRWHVGEFTTEKKQVIKGSLLVFRRLPAWSRRREEAANEEAEETAKLLGWEYAGEETGTG